MATIDATKKKAESLMSNSAGQRPVGGATSLRLRPVRAIAMWRNMAYALSGLWLLRGISFRRAMPYANAKRALPLALLILVLMTSCSTYYIPLDSFKQQFADIDSTKFKDVEVKGPTYLTYHYKANPITTIQCVDKDGNSHQIINSPSIEIRFTYGHKNKRTIFYFDRIYVGQNAVRGVESRFVESIRNTIPLDSITKIEIQDGHKKFSYVNK
ncbi:hypothetical protein SAMD00024442_11_26 [Candidatus Symbiothrix dinenymphae]|nr:hypothetical protein SAMD00024442_11_26 [Candidatus Symbiothrix dinenymphae]